MSDRLRRPALGLLIAAALLATACSSDATQPFPIPEARATATSQATPEAEPEPTRPSIGISSVQVSLNGSCHLLEEGSEIVVQYSASSPTGVLSRVQFLVDGDLVEDSGQLNQQSYSREARLKVPDGASHSFTVVAQSGGATSRSQRTIRCPDPPANGQRS